MNIAPCSKSFIEHNVKVENYTTKAFRVECSCGKAGSTAATPEEAIELWAKMNGTRPSAPADEAVKLAIEALEMGGAHNGRCHPSEDIICTNCQTRSKALTTLYNLEAKLNGGK